MAMTTWRRSAWVSLVAILIATVGVDWLGGSKARGDWEPPPPPKKHRIKGGESFPPLPLPVTPLRRTEKKRPPAAPALIGKIRYGKPIWVTTDDGRRYSYLDWRGDTTDTYHLVRHANKKLGLRYRAIDISLTTFSFKPAELPILYITGHEDFEWSPEIVQSLRQYLLDGGTFWGSPCCGSTTFAKAFIREMKKVFPERNLLALPPDHPLYLCFYKIGEVEFKEQGKANYKAKPPLVGIHIGCRLSVILSLADLCCGWARHTHPQGRRVLPYDATRIGTNMIAYALANYQLGKFLRREKVYFQKGEPTRDQFVFAQVVHEGEWDPDPSAAANLLKFLARNSTVEVQFKRYAVDLREAGDIKFPFLYMTGHRDFKFTEKEQVALRKFFARGGLLLADACCGRKAFDQAFRREIAKVLAGNELRAIPLSHPIFNILFPIQKVAYTDRLRQNQPTLTEPHLEGVTMKEVLCVVYSKYDLGCGWEGEPHAYALGVTSRDALRLTVNILIYAMTH